MDVRTTCSRSNAVYVDLTSCLVKSETMIMSGRSRVSVILAGNFSCFPKHLVVASAIAPVSEGFWAAAEEKFQVSPSRAKGAGGCFIIAPDVEVCRTW